MGQSKGGGFGRPAPYVRFRQLFPGRGERMWVYSFPDMAKGVDNTDGVGLFHV